MGLTCHWTLGGLCASGILRREMNKSNPQRFPAGDINAMLVVIST